MAICILCEENELSPRSKLTTCSNCRASMGLWVKRPQVEILNRRRKLHIYDLRMENVIVSGEKVRREVPIVKPFLSARDIKRNAKEVKRNGSASR